MSPRMSIELAADEHAAIKAEAARVGQSINRFIVTAAVARAAHHRGRRGEPAPFPSTPASQEPTP